MAARSIGSIEVEVNADTGKLTAQLRKAGEVAGAAAKRAIDDELGDIGGRELTQRLAELREEIEAALAVDIEIGLQLPRRELVEVQRQLDTLRDQTVEVDVDLDEGSLAATRAEIDAVVGEVDVKIGADVDSTDVRGALAEIDATVAAAHADVDIGAKVDTTDLIGSLAAMEAPTGPFANAGSGAGDAFTAGLADALAKSGSGGGGAFAGAAVAIAAAIAQPLAVALEGVFGASVAVVSSGMSALIGTAGAAVPLLAGVGAAVGTLTVGFQGLGEALDGDEQALRTLTPEARDFVKAFQGLKPVFDDIRRSVQGRLFAGLDDELRRLADVALPGITTGLVNVADSLNDFFRDLADVVAQIDFAGIFEAIQPALDNLLTAVVEVARAIEPFLLAAAPAAEELAGFLAAGATALADLVAANTDEIAAFLLEGVESLKEWARLGGEVLGALLTLFSAGRGAGDGFVLSLAGIVDRFDDWMESVRGQQALADFFDRAKQVMGDLKPIVEGLIGFFDRIITPEAIDRFGKITDIIGDLLPVLGTMLDLFGRFLGPVITVIGLATDALGLLAGAWDSLPGPLQDAILALTPIVGAFVIAEKVLGPVIGLVEDFAGALGRVVDVASRPLGWLGDLASHVPGLGFLGDDAEETAGKLGGMVDEGGKVNAFVAELIPLLNAYSVASAAAAVANEALRQGTIAANDAIALSAGPIGERNQALVDQREAAMDAYVAEQSLATSTERIAVAMASSLGMPRELAQGFVSLGEAARDAAADSSALGDAIGLLLSPAVNAQSALANMEQAFDDLAAQAQESVTAVGTDWVAAMDVSSQLGRDNAGAVRDQVEAMFAYAEQATAAGVSTDEMGLRLSAMRQQLEASLVTMGASETQASDYATALLGVPSLLTTLVQQPGLIDALLNAENLTLLYDAAGNPVLTEFEALGIDPAMAQTEGFKTLIENLSATRGEPTIDAPTIPEVKGDVEGLQTGVEDLDGTTADPTVTVSTAPEMQRQLDDLQTTMDDIGAVRMVPSIAIPTLAPLQTKLDDLHTSLKTIPDGTARVTIPTLAGVQEKVDELASSLRSLPDGSANVTVTGVQSGIDKVRELARAIDALHDRTITVRTNNVSSGTPGGMAGALVTGPTTMRVGERGYREAIIPLDLPLSRVDPTVRQLAALLRGEGPTVGAVQPVGPRTVVNQRFELSSADPAAVAVQVLNRAAAAASR